MPLFSVIVPCFNSSKTILQTLNSVKNQEIDDFECIIVNDCSSDNSVEFINKNYQNDKRFKLINLESNQGVSNARNIGIDYSSGRYISFLDSDDIWHKNFIRTALLIREKRKYAITHSPYLRFQKKENSIFAKLIHPPQIIDYKNIRKKNYLPLLSAVIDRKIVGDFKFKNIRPEDYCLWLELIEDRKLYSTSTSVVSSFYRVSESQRSTNKIKSIKRIYNLFRKERKLNKHKALKYTLIWIKNNSLEKLEKFEKIDKFKNEFKSYLDN